MNFRVEITVGVHGSQLKESPNSGIRLPAGTRGPEQGAQGSPGFTRNS